VLAGTGQQLAGQDDLVLLASTATDVTINGDGETIIYVPGSNPGHLTLNGSNDVLSGPTNTVISRRASSSTAITPPRTSRSRATATAARW
jgi:NAD(P)H-hydrate repair Nnr-like enzyme with NAD(P)H-hydrate dehydratase domain